MKRKSDSVFELGLDTERWLNPRQAGKWLVIMDIFREHWKLNETTAMICGKVISLENRKS